MKELNSMSNVSAAKWQVLNAGHRYQVTQVNMLINSLFITAVSSEKNVKLL